MSATGARKRLKDRIIKILSDWLMLEHYGEYEEVAADIMALVPKPEKCVMYKVKSPTAAVVYFKCSKCENIQFDIPDNYCPHCARRVIATKDMSLWI